MGAVFTDDDRAGIGVIIRDCQGLVLASMSQTIPLPLSVVELETLAAAKALEFSINLGFDSIILERDLEIVMKSLMDDSPSLVSFVLLIQDVKTYEEHFQRISFSRVGKKTYTYVISFSVWMKNVLLYVFAVY